MTKIEKKEVTFEITSSLYLITIPCIIMMAISWLPF